MILDDDLEFTTVADVTSSQLEYQKTPHQIWQYLRAFLILTLIGSVHCDAPSSKLALRLSCLYRNLVASMLSCL